MADVSRSPLTPAIERARALIASGDLGSARVLLERAVELGRENLGEDEPDVLTAQRELAGVFLRSDDPMAARRMLEDAYAAGQWRLGDGDPVILHISHDLGVVAQELGNRHEARKAFGRVAANGPAALGGAHQFVIRARSYLGEDSSTTSVRPDTSPAQPMMTPSIAPARPPVNPVRDGTPAQSVNPVVDGMPAPSVDPVAGAVPTSSRGPVADVVPPGSDVTQDTGPVPVSRAEAGGADVRAALERPTDVLPVTRPAPVSRAETRFVSQPEETAPRPGGRSGGPWDTAPIVPEQRQPGMVQRSRSVQPTYPREGQAPPQQTSPQQQASRQQQAFQREALPPQQAPGYGPAHGGHVVTPPSRDAGWTGYPPSQQGKYGTVDSPQAVHQGGYLPEQHGTGQSSGWAGTPRQESGAGQPYRGKGRGVAVGLTVVATLVAIVAVAALVVVLVKREEAAPVTPVATVSAGVPQLSGAPPTEVRLGDHGTAIDVSWRDPSDGKAPFMVTMAREGQQLKPVAQVGLGKTRTTVAGLNPKLQYCFAVVAVYASDRFASSNQACTDRR